MTKILEIVQINSGYTSYVDLYEEYYDLVKNHGRMERYKPITAHRQVFEKIANALNLLDRRCYFLSGSYGTGKSHLLLMLANYFANPSDVPEIEAFFRNYEVAQSEILLKPGEELRERRAVSLKEARKSGRYLVALVVIVSTWILRVLCYVRSKMRCRKMNPRFYWIPTIAKPFAV